MRVLGRVWAVCLVWRLLGEYLCLSPFSALCAYTCFRRLHPDRVGKVASISGTARSSPGAIAMRYAQRSGTFIPHSTSITPNFSISLISDNICLQPSNDTVRTVLMADPNWNRGFYYDGLPPHTGMKLARQIATITYRSGPEWDQRFGRKLREVPPPPTITSTSSSTTVITGDDDEEVD